MKREEVLEILAAHKEKLKALGVESLDLIENKQVERDKIMPVMPVAIDIGTLITTNPRIHGGCPIIAGTGVTVRRIALDYKMGLSPEEITQEIPHLSLSQVYVALAFYHTNKDLIEADIAAQEAEVERLEAEHIAG